VQRFVALLFFRGFGIDFLLGGGYNLDNKQCARGCVDLKKPQFCQNCAKVFGSALDATAMTAEFLVTKL
jgi:hypothetical protein